MIPTTSRLNLLLRILAFFIVATVVANVFRFNLPGWYQDFYLPFGLYNLKYLLEGIVFVVLYVVFRKFSAPEYTIGLIGRAPANSLVITLLPLALFSSLGVSNEHGLNEHYYGFLIGVVVTSYVIFEELGWRGVLQQELEEVSPVIRYITIGIIWYLWHLSFLTGEVDPVREATVLLVLIAASWGLGQIALKTKSILLCSSFHLAVNVLMFSPLIAGGMSSNERYMVASILLVAGIVLSNWKWSGGSVKRIEQMETAS